MDEYDPYMLYESYSFVTWRDDTFIDLFRVSKDSAVVIIEKIKFEIMKYGYNRSLSNMHLKVLIALRYYATGSLIEGCIMFNVSLSQAKIIIEFVSHAIATLSYKFINFPKNHYVLSKIKKDFFNISKFPMVVGAVDFTHIKIKSPENIAEKYRNRRDFFSINVQIVCDSSLRIQNIDARWPGSTQNSRIFKNSKIRRKFERGEIRNGVLVGDIYVPQRNYLMTPIEESHTVIDSSTNITARDIFKYNDYLFRTISIAQCTHYAWKRRFPVLATGIDVDIAPFRNIIIATAVLHNIACQNRDELPSVSDEIQFSMGITAFNNPHDNIGNRKRNEVNNRRIKLLQYIKNVD